MKKKIDVPMLSKRSVSGTAEKATSFQQAKRRSRFKLILAWSIVLLPLVWGLYVTGQTVAPLLHALRSKP
jgi:hypothetical protein